MLSTPIQVRYRVQMYVTRCSRTLPDAFLRYHIHLHLVLLIYDAIHKAAILLTAPPRARLCHDYCILRQLPE